MNSIHGHIQPDTIWTMRCVIQYCSYSDQDVCYSLTMEFVPQLAFKELTQLV